MSVCTIFATWALAAFVEIFHDLFFLARLGVKLFSLRTIDTKFLGSYWVEIIVDWVGNDSTRKFNGGPKIGEPRSITRDDQKRKKK